MIGDRYRVFFHMDGGTHQHDQSFNSWIDAKAARGDVFRDARVKAVWIIRDNPSLELQQERFGHTLRRTKHGVTSS